MGTNWEKGSIPGQRLFYDRNRLVFPSKADWWTSIAFRKMLYAVIEKRGYADAIVDLSLVTKAYPNGMVPIITELDTYRQKGSSFEIIEPHETQVKHLFERNGWLHYLDRNRWELPRSTWGSSLPLQRFDSDEELNDIVTKCVEVCLQQLVFAEGVPQAFEWALNEIAGNVLVHSETSVGWIQVVTFKDSHKLALIVCDAGIGIPESMRETFSFRSDQEALDHAMQKGVTSKPKFGQGNGLAGALAIAQHSKGMFAVTSARGRVAVHDGKVEQQPFYPPYQGTCVEMQFATDNTIDLPKALWGHKPVDYIEAKFEGEKGSLRFRLREYASSFGNRITGQKIRNLVRNLLIQNPGHHVEIEMDDIAVISSSFADELFGKLFVEMGAIEFSRLVRVKGINAICKSIVDQSVAQRIFQTVRDDFTTGILSPVAAE